MQLPPGAIAALVQLLFWVKLLFFPLPRVTPVMTSGMLPVLVTVVASHDLHWESERSAIHQQLAHKAHIDYIYVAGSIQRNGGGIDEPGYRHLAGSCLSGRSAP